VAVRQANSADKAGGRVTGPAARHSESVTLRGTHKAEDRSSFRRHTGWRRFSSALRTCFGVKTVPMTIMSKPAADLVIDSDLVRALSRARFRDLANLPLVEARRIWGFRVYLPTNGR